MTKLRCIKYNIHRKLHKAFHSSIAITNKILIQNSAENQNNANVEPTATAIVPVTNEQANTQDETPVLPNYDAQYDMFDESLSKRGKIIAESENLSFQRKAIMDKSFYQSAYRNISESGVLWHLPPSYIKRPKFSIKERWKDFSNSEYSIGSLRH